MVFAWCAGSVLWPSGGVPAFAHPDAITYCRGNIIYKSAKKVGKTLLLQNGLVAEDYDTNGDKKADVRTLSTTFDGGKTHNPNPIFWLVDINHDGEVDYVYVDKKGLGLCIDIVLYEDRTSPMMNGADTITKNSATDRGGRL
jgi:hypothetical protein